MTYKDIIDRFKTVANAHYMLKDFGYGQLSDIKVHSQDGEADYPYLFLNPSTHTRTAVNMLYNFNMIVMDVATDEDDEYSNYTAIQSKCQQYIDDVIAEMYYGYTDKPEILYDNITYTPFKERFQDSVAGMTATISILVPTPINKCIAPFDYEIPVPPTPTTCEGPILVNAFSTGEQVFQPDVENSPLAATNIVTNDGGWRTPEGNFYTPQTANPTNWVISGTAEMMARNAGDINNPFVLSQTGGIRNEPDEVYGWPTTLPEVGETWDFTLVYNNIVPIGSNIEAIQNLDVPGTQAIIKTSADTQIQICSAVNCLPEYPNFASSISQIDNTVTTTNTLWRFGSNLVADPAIGTWSNNVFNNAVLGTFEFIIDADITFTNPGVGETFPVAPTLLVNYVIDVAANCIEDNWPTSYVAGTFRWRARYAVNLQSLAPVNIITDSTTFADYTVGVGATLNIGYQA